MNYSYLEPKTLQVFICCLLNNKKFNLSILSIHEMRRLIQEIYDNDLKESFLFTVNEINMSKSSALLKRVYLWASIDKNANSSLISTRNIIKIISKTSEDDKIDISDLKNTLDSTSHGYYLIYTILDMNIIGYEKEKLDKFLFYYIKNFSENNLNKKNKRYHDIKENIIEICKFLKPHFKKHMHPTPIIISEISDLISSKSKMRFFESLLYLKKKKYIDINSYDFFNIEISFNKSPYEILAMEIHSLGFDIQGLDLKEILNDIAFIVSYDDKIDRVSIYDNVNNNKYYIKRFSYDSPNSLIFKFLQNNQEEPISKENIEEELKIEIKKDLSEVVRDLGFDGILRTIFFNVSKSKITFHSYATIGQVKGLEEKIINHIKEIINHNKKISKD